MKNLFSLKAHAMARTVSNDPLLKYKYKVSVTGLPATMGFNKVSGLKREIGTVEYNEGGYSHTHKLQGKEKVEPVTLERGMFVGDSNLYTLYKKALGSSDTRVVVTIELLDKAGATAFTWKLAEAWAKTWEGSDMDANSEDVAIEKITFEFEYFEE